MSVKGSWSRVTDKKSYQKNYSKIFRRGEMSKLVLNKQVKPFMACFVIVASTSMLVGFMTGYKVAIENIKKSLLKPLAIEQKVSYNDNDINTRGDYEQSRQGLKKLAKTEKIRN
jgi:hypothetical protein